MERCYHFIGAWCTCGWSSVTTSFDLGALADGAVLPLFLTLGTLADGAVLPLYVTLGSFADGAALPLSMTLFTIVSRVPTSMNIESLLLAVHAPL